MTALLDTPPVKVKLPVRHRLKRVATTPARAVRRFVTGSAYPTSSIIGGAAAAAPGAGASVCSVTVLDPGVYSVKITIWLAATTEVNLNNGQIVIAPAGITQTVPTVTGIAFTVEMERVVMASVGVIQFKATAAATAGSVYAAYITATRIG